jgi:hypothetical protein
MRLIFDKEIQAWREYARNTILDSRMWHIYIYGVSLFSSSLLFKYWFYYKGKFLKALFKDRWLKLEPTPEPYEYQNYTLSPKIQKPQISKIRQLLQVIEYWVGHFASENTLFYAYKDEISLPQKRRSW